MPSNLLQPVKLILKENSRGAEGSRYTIPRAGLYPYQWNWDSAFVAMGLFTFDEERAWEELHTLCSGQWDDGMLPHIVYHEAGKKTYTPGPEHWQARGASGKKTSGVSNPPVLTLAVRMMLERARNPGLARREAGRLFPVLFNWHKWWHSSRDPEQTGLVSTFHPWETGRDNSPDWSGAMGRVCTDDVEPYERKDILLMPLEERPRAREYDVFMTLLAQARDYGYNNEKLLQHSSFHVKDTTVNFILARANRDLLWIAHKLLQEPEAGAESGVVLKIPARADSGSPPQDIDRRRTVEHKKAGSTDDPAVATECKAAIPILEKWIARQESALLTLWNDKEKAYQPFDMLTGEHVGGISSASFLAPLAGLDAHISELIQHLEKWHRKGYLLPSYNPNASHFDSRRYWRGPVWVVINYLVSCGLRQVAKRRAEPEEAKILDIAESILIDTALLTGQSGMSEYFDPLTAHGLGGDRFSWTAATWLHWIHPELERLEDLVKRRMAAG